MIVLLIPLAKGSSKYFHKYIYPYAEIVFINGRLKFEPLIGQKRSSNPMGSILAIFRQGGGKVRQTIFEQPAEAVQ